MSRYQWDWLIWGVRWILVDFLVFELAAVWWKGCPWTTFSRFVWDDEQRWTPTMALVETFGLVLTAHLVFKLSAAALITVCVLGAAALAVHFLFGTP